jgi:hypothetical protein
LGGVEGGGVGDTSGCEVCRGIGRQGGGRARGWHDLVFFLGGGVKRGVGEGGNGEGANGEVCWRGAVRVVASCKHKYRRASH